MKKRKQSRNWLEWIVTAISTVIVIFVIGILIYQVVAVKETSPEFLIDLGKIEAGKDHFSIPLTVKNSGTVTAQNLRIEFSMGEGTDTESALVEFDYLPGNSKVKGWISFLNNPEGKTIKSHILGYTVP